MKKTSFPGLGTLGRCAVIALSIGTLAACNSNGQNGDNDGGNGDGGNGDGGNGGPPFMITVMRAGGGMGKVTSQPAGITCDGTGSCSATFNGGTAVTLTAQGLGSAFSGWTGACAGQSATCQISPTGDVTTTASFDPLSCTPDSICWEAPLPFGMDLKGVYALATNNVWAVGTAGSTLHYDGTSWRRVQTNTTQDLLGVWGRNANDVWAAAGDNGLLVHYNGSNWANVTSINTYRITGITGAGTNNLYASTYTVNALHSTNNGTSWNAINTNVRSVGQLTGITSSGASDVWAWDNDCGKTRWNGSGWTAMTRDLSWCTQAIYSFGAGDTYAIRTLNPALYHYTSGTNFTAGTAIPSAVTGALGLWGTSVNNLTTSSYTGILYRYDGTNWGTTQTSTREASIYGSIHGTAANDTWAVGQRGVITHFDGTNATAQRANVFSDDLVSVWGTAANNVYFATKVGSLVHFNGTAYTEGAKLLGGGGAGIKHIHGTAADDIWLAGVDSTNKNVLMHGNGQTFTATTIDSAVPPGGIERVYAASRTVVWAAPTNLVNPLSWDGTQWQIDFSLGWADSINALWGTSANDVWMAAGTNVFHNNGSAWSQSAGISATVYSFGGTSASDIWAGASGGVYHFNGSNWSAMMNVAGSNNIVSVSATATNDVWFVDALSQVYRYNGSTFRRIDTSLGTVTGTPMYSWAADANNVWFGGRGILSYRR